MGYLKAYNYLFNCLTKLAKLLCLKCRGRTFFVNSVFCIYTVITSTWWENLIWEYFFLLYIEYNETISRITPSNNMAIGRIFQHPITAKFFLRGEKVRIQTYKVSSPVQKFSAISYCIEVLVLTKSLEPPPAPPEPDGLSMFSDAGPCFWRLSSDHVGYTVSSF